VDAITPIPLSCSPIHGYVCIVYCVLPVVFSLIC
jgi:hypothetical protein